MRSSEAHRDLSPRAESISIYLKEIGVYPLLSDDEEAALGSRIRAGDTTALDILVCANLRFVVAVAKRYQYQGVSLGDLIDEGNVGLLRAASRFDESRGIRFISYAVWWIRQAIVESVAQQSRVVRVPVGQIGAMYEIGKRRSALQQHLGRNPTSREIAAELQVPEEDIDEAARLSRSEVSLDAPLAGDSDTRLLDYIADESTESPDDLIADNALNETLERALANLKPRDAQVLRLYFGLAGGEPSTLEEIARGLNITRERVRSIRDKALARIRKGPEAGVLAALAG